jgi:type VI secretion system secreted protein VgrG
MSENIDLLSITTPLPATSFVVTGLMTHEVLSDVFHYHIELSTGSQLLDPNSLLDQPVTVTLGDPAGARGGAPIGRYFNGVVATVTQLPQASTKLWYYRLDVVPKLYVLKQTQDCRFYHNMAAPALIATILGEFDIVSSNKLQGTYTTRDYSVQFNESYFDFLQRVMANEGIFYFFTHTASAHTLVLADSPTVFANVLNPNVMLQDSTARWTGLSSIRRIDSTAIGKYTFDDYDPSVNTLTQSGSAIRGQEPTILGAGGASSRTFYHWPAVRGTTTDAGAKASTHMLAAEAMAQLYAGEGGAADFLPGGTFELSDDPMGVGTYAIRTVTYTAHDSATGVSGAGGHPVMSFTAFPASASWREPVKTKPPVMAGLYSGIVVGSAGEEINVDSLGRIQVWFPWDTRGEITAAGSATFWARVVQPWAGPNWGTQFIPRVGMEVAVAFLEGDVNRPVVVGSMVNVNATPVFAVAQKNKSGIRTRSTLSGGDTNFNEFSFDDTKGSELFYLHAEKDYTTEVENNQSLTVSNDRTVNVTNDESVTITGKQTIAVTKDQSLTVSQGNQSITVSEGNRTISVNTGNVSETVGSGNHSLTVSQGNHSVSISQGNQSTTLDAGNMTIKLDGGAMSITAQTSIKLAVGGNSVEITPSGVTINGMQISLSASASLSASGASVSISGEGDASLSAPSVMVG